MNIFRDGKKINHLKNGLQVPDRLAPGAAVILAGGHEGDHEDRQPHEQGLHQRAVLKPNVVVRNTACNQPRSNYDKPVLRIHDI